MRRRPVLIATRAFLLLCVAGITALAAELTRPLVHGWAETVGFGAGLLTALAGVAALLLVTGRRRTT